MARITVEDCIDKFESRFELVLVASNRARKLHSGENPTVEKDNDKNTVIALREIAEEKLTTNDLKNDLIEEYQVATFDHDEEIGDMTYYKLAKYCSQLQMLSQPLIIAHLSHDSI